ncbi:hypothetical protein FWF89_03860 [Candidatus Saccharibacteria bacterium]|nr:hypothetical protein [Candidatus Saccharibacteria bacterium]
MNIFFWSMLIILIVIAAGIVFLVGRGKPKMQGIGALLVSGVFLFSLFSSFSTLGWFPLYFFMSLIANLAGIAAALLLAVQCFSIDQKFAKNQTIKTVAKTPWFKFAPIIIIAAAGLYLLCYIIAAASFSTMGLQIVSVFMDVVLLFGPLFVFSFILNDGIKK